jgi:hypothetical protein
VGVVQDESKERFDLLERSPSGYRVRLPIPLDDIVSFQLRQMMVAQFHRQRL